VMRDFPDGETYIRVDTPPAAREVVLVATIRHPNDKTLPLIFLADAVRDLGASRVGLVAPYLAYMRQDARFRPGEAVTSRSFARLISRSMDWLLTVDPHLHRFATLRDLYSVPAAAAHAAPDLGKWIAYNISSPWIIGPDAESFQWVKGIAAAAGAPFSVLAKDRRSDTEVIESIPDSSAYRSRTPVLVDDIISTGHTMIAAIEHLRGDGSPAPACVAVHAVFAEGAYDELQAAGASCVVTTNTIPHPSNCVDVTPALAAALRDNLGRDA